MQTIRRKDSVSHVIATNKAWTKTIKVQNGYKTFPIASAIILPGSQMGKVVL